MTWPEAIRHIAALRGKSLRTLAVELGHNPNGASTHLGTKDARLRTMCEFLSVTGYELYAVPVGAKPPEGSVRIEATNA